MFKEYLNREGAALYLRNKGLPCASSTLSKLASIGGGPKFRKFSRNVVYLPAELDEWICSRLSGPKSSTCDPGRPEQSRPEDQISASSFSSEANNHDK